MYAIKRNGFAMILAIFVVLLIALGGVMLLSNASISNKSVGDNYLRAQAELLAQSATEYAVMRVQGFDQTAGGGHCLDRINITVNDAGNNAMFDVNVSIAYVFRGAAPALCDAVAVLDQSTLQDTRILVDTTVTTHPEANISTEPIRVHTRSWQSF